MKRIFGRLKSPVAAPDLAEAQVAILNAIPANIALLDAQGVIRVVNEAWKQFAGENTFQNSSFGVGAHYLEVCGRASGEGAAEAAQAAQGLRQVLNGERREFSFEYACHSLTEKRWFRMMVTPLSADRPAGVMVMHINITERRLGEEALRASEREQRQLAHELERERSRLVEAQAVAKVGNWETDLVTLRVHWSAETHRIFETDPATFSPTHAAFLERVHPEDRADVDAAFRQSFGACGSHLITHRLLFPDGGIKFIEERWQVFHDEKDRPLRATGTCQDITARALSERRIVEEQRFNRTLIEASPLAVIAYRATGEGVLANVASMHMLGAPDVAAVRAQNFREIAAWRTSGLLAVAEDVLTSGQPREHEIHTRNSFGKDIWLHCRLIPLTYEGEPYLLGFFDDIRERKHAEEERDRLFRVSLDMLCVAGFDGRLQQVNPAWTECLGWSAQELTSRPMLDFIHPEDHAVTMQKRSQLQQGVPVRGFENRYRCKDGTYRWLSWSVHPLLESQQVFSVARDVTAVRQARVHSAEQAALLDKAQDAILVRDLEHRITYWNKSAERLYGWTKTEALGRLERELLYFEREVFDRAMQQLLAAGDWVGELDQISKDGKKRVIEGHWTLLREEDGTPKSVLAINTDITERKHLEQQFLRAQRMESLGTLAGGIAHDLNNLLAPIVMGVDLLRHFDPSPRSLPVIENIERSAKRGAELIRQVLSFARGVEGSRVTLQVRHTVREIESIMTNTFPKNIVLDSSASPELWPVLADPTQLNQIVLNLCVNARDAMPEGGRLELTASNVEIDEQYAVMNRGVTAGRYVMIQVLDTGCGMSREIIDRIFEPFFTTKELGKGTGLGLSTVLGIVRSHGGFVNVYSEPGKGSTFKVYLPAHTEAAMAKVTAQSAGELPRGHGEMILVVDDETSVLDITQATLTAFGYRVLTAEDGAQAIALYALHREEVTLVLTDMMMPVMDGPVLISALRRIKPQVRIIAASGLNTNADIARAAGVGVHYFLPKPYSADALLMMIRKVLQETGSRPPM